MSTGVTRQEIGKGVRVVNVTRANCLPGAGPFDFDSAVVLSETESEPHIITGQMQPKCLFRGSLIEAHEFVRKLP
jgi:hypothetical protein